MEYYIPHSRELSKYEKELLSYLLDLIKPKWVEKVPYLKVVARCGCGKCPTVLFSEEKGYHIAQFQGKGEKGQHIGIDIIGNNTEITELEFWNIDGKYDHISLPLINTIEKL